MSEDTTAFATAREATLRQAQIRSDLLGLLDVIHPAELLHRWRACGVTIEDLKRARVAVARSWHPDQRPGDTAASRRLARANALIDRAVSDRKLGDANLHEAAIR